MSKFIDFLRWRTWPTAVAEIMANQTVVTKTPVKRRKLSQDALRRRNHSLASRAERRRLEHMTHVLPPPQGHRRPEFCGDDDLLWSTQTAKWHCDVCGERKVLGIILHQMTPGHCDACGTKLRLVSAGDITSGLVQPRKSIWSLFK